MVRLDGGTQSSPEVGIDVRRERPREAAVPESRSSATARLLATADSPGRARRLVADVASGMPSAVVHDAMVVTSEIVTNSVRHAGGVVTISIECDADMLAVAVADGCVLPPTASQGDVLADGGRGLRLVAQMADAWGYRPSADGAGKVIWFRIAHRRDKGHL